uniref:Uncharacterized protein n=1 Tax=Anguilla anguilla TaxID=7936 RepID=A0A0E9QG64_ANGAN
MSHRPHNPEVNSLCAMEAGTTTTSISWVISTFREHFNRSAFLGEPE